MDKNVNTPLVTVLMPVYNADLYLKEAVESILAQSYSHFELLIINDGSVDGSVNIIKSFTDERVHLVENETNLGLIATLNKGFDLAKGKYIARMDADDVALPNRLKEQVVYLEKNEEVGVYGCGYVDLKHEQEGKQTVFLSDHDALKSVLFFNSCMGHPTVMFRTELLRANELKYNPEFKHAEDYEFWVRTIELTKFSNSPKVLLQYRIHDKQVSTTEAAAQKVVAAHIRLFMIEKLGIKPTETEMYIHNSIGNKETLKGFENVQRAELWLMKLIQANDQKHHVKTDKFKAYLSLIFQDICANASVGLRAYRFYKRSALSHYGNQSFMFKLKLMVKCLVR